MEQLQIICRDSYIEAIVAGVDDALTIQAYVNALVAACLRQQVNKLLVELHDIDTLWSTWERFRIGISIEEFARHGIQVAAVVGSSALDLQQFAQTAATSRGLALKLFSSREQARHWLLQSHAA